jgi:hypothetical protein
MDQSSSADIIEQKYHPGSRAFTRVASQELRAVLELPLPLPEDIWDQWTGIEEKLAEKNLIMFPALPEAQEGEDVRVYRKDAPLTQLLEAMLFPTTRNDATLARAISALNPHHQRRNEPARPTGNHGQRNGERPTDRNDQNSHGTRADGQRPSVDHAGSNRAYSDQPNAYTGRNDGRNGGGRNGGGRRQERNRDWRPISNSRNTTSYRQQLGRAKRPGDGQMAAQPDYQDFDRRSSRPLA